MEDPREEKACTAYPLSHPARLLQGGRATLSGPATQASMTQYKFVAAVTVQTLIIELHLI